MSVRAEKNGPITTVILSRPERRNAVGAGADLSEIAAGRPNHVEAVDSGADGPLGPTRLRLGKPVIAAVAGYAVAGGLELAAWCDLRVADESAVFGVFSRRFGVPLIDGGTVRLPQLLGMSRALDLSLAGRPVDAREALAIGLCNDLASVYEIQGLETHEALQVEHRLGSATLRSAEAEDGAKRFVAGAVRGGRFRP